MQSDLQLNSIANHYPNIGTYSGADRRPPGLDPAASLAQGDRERTESQIGEAIRILLVEDDFLIAMQIEAAVIEAGYRVVGIAVSAEEAIELAAAYRPALAIMDIRLIGPRDGVDAALELYRNFGIRCIFASAHSDPHVKERAKPAEPLNWLRKPYTTASLIEAVKQALNELQQGRN